MRNLMCFDKSGPSLHMAMAKKGEKALVPNYLVNVLSAIVVLAVCAIVAGVGVTSFRGAKGWRAAIPEAPTAVMLPDANEPLELSMTEEWGALTPSPRPILCFLNREGFLRPPPDTLILRQFPGLYCNDVVYNSLAFDNATFHLLADATDDAIIYQLTRVRSALFPHWKVVLNVFVDGYAAKKMQEGSKDLLDSLFAWLGPRRRIDGLNFEFADDAFLGSVDASREVVSFFASAKADPRRGNLSLSAMMSYAATMLLHEELSLTIDRVLVKTHGLLDEPTGTTQLAAPLDYAGLTHHRSNHHTVVGLLEELEEHLGRKTCFTIALSGTAFTLKSPSQCDVGDPVVSGQLGKTSFSDVCADAPDRVKKIEDDVAYTAENYSWVTHEDQFTVFEKTAKVLRHWNLLCIAAVDVDLDDVRGQCGRAYPLLRRIYETSYMLQYSRN